MLKIWLEMGIESRRRQSLDRPKASRASCCSFVAVIHLAPWHAVYQRVRNRHSGIEGKRRRCDQVKISATRIEPVAILSRGVREPHVRPGEAFSQNAGPHDSGD